MRHRFVLSGADGLNSLHRGLSAGPFIGRQFFVRYKPVSNSEPLRKLPFWLFTIYKTAKMIRVTIRSSNARLSSICYAAVAVYIFAVLLRGELGIAQVSEVGRPTLDPPRCQTTFISNAPPFLDSLIRSNIWKPIMALLQTDLFINGQVKVNYYTRSTLSNRISIPPAQVANS